MDGDLDLMLVHEDGPLELLCNDPDGTFQRIEAEAGIAGNGKKIRGLVVFDFDHDGDLDVLLLHEGADHRLLLNDLAWKYHEVTTTELSRASMEVAVAVDVNSDGFVELFTSDGSAITQWSCELGSWSASLLDVDRHAARAWRWLSTADVDGDGRPELLAASEDEWVVFKIGNGSLAALANGQRRLSACTLAVLDDQHGPSLLLVGEEPVPVVFPPGPGRFPFVTIRPIGSAEASMSQQSNKSGIGTRIELYAGGGPLRLADALRTGSGPGQSDQPIAIGIGRAAEADLVRLVWPDGVVQAEAHLAPGLHRIVETRPEVYW